ncbi:MAG: hypothetical protein ACTS2F_00505 [Thainema sp.]
MINQVEADSLHVTQPARLDPQQFKEWSRLVRQQMMACLRKRSRLNIESCSDD